MIDDEIRTDFEFNELYMSTKKRIKKSIRGGASGGLRGKLPHIDPLDEAGINQGVIPSNKMYFEAEKTTKPAKRKR